MPRARRQIELNGNPGRRNWQAKQESIIDAIDRKPLPDVLPELPPLNQKLPISRRANTDGEPERRCRSCGDYLPENPTFFRVTTYDPYSMSHVCRDCTRVIYAERNAANRNRHRARRQGIASEQPIGATKELYAQQGGRCYYCNIEFDRFLDDAYHLEHKIPLSRGGTNDRENLVLSCGSCNSQKHTKTPEEWKGPAHVH